MSRKNKNNSSNRTVRQSKNPTPYVPHIIQKPLSLVRNDVRIWRNALAMALHPDNPKMYPLYNLYDDVLTDARLFSQMENRKQKTIGAMFNILKPNGELHEELTSQLQKSLWFDSIINHILDSRFMGYTLIELDINDSGVPVVSLVPRQNVLPTKGIVLKDISDDNGEDYLHSSHYGSWLLDFGVPRNVGIINKAVPHILFKKFAQSCWSELCEIFGIPPRVMKTNTQNTAALNRAEQMMRDMAAAAWFIIDETEDISWATGGQPANGDVYNGLIRLCNDEISLLISGAIIGQDTQFGTRGKEQVSESLLTDLVNADQTMVEQYMNDKVLPALYLTGILSEADLRFEYDKSEDLTELWTRTREILPYKEVDNEWIKSKFGIEVIGNKAASLDPSSKLKAESWKLEHGFFD